MRLNREKIAAFLAAAILVIGLIDVVLGFMSPSRGLSVPDITIPRSAREVISRNYRRFPEEGQAVEEEPSRNPFSFSEGWQVMELMPMASPPLGPAARPIPFLGGGTSPAEAGFMYQDQPPAESKEAEESP